MSTTYFRNDGWVKASTGSAVPGAQVFVCLQPANAPATLQPTPPSPQAFIFSDPEGTVPLSQPLIADGFGHYNFYAVSGQYTILIYLSGRLQNQYPDQLVG